MSVHNFSKTRTIIIHKNKVFVVNRVVEEPRKLINKLKISQSIIDNSVKIMNNHNIIIITTFFSCRDNSKSINILFDISIGNTIFIKEYMIWFNCLSSFDNKLPNNDIDKRIRQRQSYSHIIIENEFDFCILDCLNFNIIQEYIFQIINIIIVRFIDIACSNGNRITINYWCKNTIIINLGNVSVHYKFLLNLLLCNSF